DGCCSEDPVFTEVYNRLVLADINKGTRTLAAMPLFNEDMKQWKGEPFEQALMLTYLSMYHAANGSWDNARPAAGSSLFRLKDFGGDKKLTNKEMVEAKARDTADTDLSKYQERQTDF